MAECELAICCCQESDGAQALVGGAHLIEDGREVLLLGARRLGEQAEDADLGLDEVVVGGIDVAERELLNDKRRVNKYLEAVNQRLPIGGVFEGRVESARIRREAMLAKFPRPLNKLIYAVDYLLHRVWPKLPYARALYFAITSCTVVAPAWLCHPAKPVPS